MALAVFLSLMPAMPCGAEDGNAQYAYGVTEEMCDASYWVDKVDNPDEVMMTAKEIAEYNTFAAHSEGTFMVALEEIPEEFDADKIRSDQIEKMAAFKDSINESGDELYIGGEKIDTDKYFDKFIEAIEKTGWKGTIEPKYGVCVCQAELMAIPSDDVIGYSADDPDSEFQDSSINVNDPVVIMQYCSYDGLEYYFVNCDHYSGWINVQFAAVCADRNEWLDAWQADIDSKDILVVTQDKIVTEQSILVPETSEVRLNIGTVLKLVKESDLPENIGERNSWNNYTVYLPTRDEEGNYVKRQALISQHYDVSIGYLPMTQRNLLDLAFTCLGDCYGWSGMHDSMDCSLYVRNVYRCFGLRIPRNTTWQVLVPNTCFDVSEMTDEEKIDFLKNVPAGTALYFPGHTMLLTGFEGDTGYVISALGSAADSVGDGSVMDIYSVTINPLTVRRRNGSTWLTNINCVVIPANYAGLKYDPAAEKEEIIEEVPQENEEDVCFLCGEVHSGFGGWFAKQYHKALGYIYYMFSKYMREEYAGA